MWTQVSEEQLNALRCGDISNWNEWRKGNPDAQPDLRDLVLAELDLRNVDLSASNLCGATLCGSNLAHANLWRVFVSGGDFSRTDLTETDAPWSYFNGVRFHNAVMTKAVFKESNLTRCGFDHADMRDADLAATYLPGASLRHADLRGAILEHAVLIDTDISQALFTGSYVFGVSAWGLQGTPKDQSNLVITPQTESDIVVDSLEVAQFVYLISHNQKLRDVIQTVGKKVVLILGRFTDERKGVLEAIRSALRKGGYVPVLFDFSKPAEKNLTETVSLLAQMARFVLADITDAKSIPHELQRIVPDNPSLPVQPIILSSQYEYAMFKDFLDYPWVLLPHRYDDVDSLLASLSKKVIDPAIRKSKEIEIRRRKIDRQLSKR